MKRGRAGRPAPDPRARATVRFRVRFDESRPDGSIRPSVLLRYAADLAWAHSENLGFGRDWYREQGLAWLVRGVEVDILRRVDHGDLLDGTTEVVASRKVMARRRSEFRAADGSLSAVVVVDWALTSAAGPTRIPEVFGIVFVTGGASFEPIRVRAVPTDGADTSRLELVVRPHELDPMGHVNNAVYLDWVEEAVATANPGPERAMAYPRRYRLEYLAAAGPDQRVRVIVWPDRAAWNCRIVDAESDEPFLGARLDG